MVTIKKLKKVVYEDNGITKVIKGYIIKEDDFVYEIEALNDGAIITIGKRAIIRVSDGAVNNGRYW